jgi:hypothetical protein
MKKKASLSLSINAIVILVLAITMLGLGLAFTKGMFGKLSSKLSVPEPDIPATADDPIVLPSEELSITKNKEFIFSVNVYNDNFANDVTGTLTCEKSPTATTDLAKSPWTVSSSPQKIPAGEDKGFKIIIPKDELQQSFTRVCTLSFADAPDNVISKQIVVSVK